jgi:hypothetical protein
MGKAKKEKDSVVSKVARKHREGHTSYAQFGFIAAWLEIPYNFAMIAGSAVT